jgi:phosphatidate cytidylyltransferase
MIKRIFSTVALWAFLGVLLWRFENSGAVILVGIIGMLTLREFYKFQTAAGRVPFAKLGMAFGTLITVAPWLEVRYGWPSDRLMALAVILFSIRILGEREANRRASSLSSTLFGVVYVSVTLQYLVRILTPHTDDLVSAQGRLLLALWVVVVAKMCDTGALLTGLALGRHKMAPDISPKKTWEGAIGGVITSVAVGTTFAWFSRHQTGICLPLTKAALIAIPVAIVSIVSDLVESILKREAAIKDSGTSIPGIGGIFDLSDSILLAAPVGFFLLGLK